MKINPKWNWLLENIHTFNGITADSRAVHANYIFVAGKGLAQDGRLFIQQAIERGASCIVAEDLFIEIENIHIVNVLDYREALSRLAAAFYKYPARNMRIIGITGTCGKTTTTYLLEAILIASGEKVGVIGSVNIRYPKMHEVANLTTPDPIYLHKILAQMLDAGCTYVIMEVSSHALEQKRVAGIDFTVAAFTNLSSEHLDYHGTMENYFAAKAQFFLNPRLYAVNNAVINVSEPFGVQLLAKLQKASGTTRVITYNVNAIAHKTTLAGIEINIENTVLHTHLMGIFNAYNVICAVKIACVLGINITDITKGLLELKGVPGRLERISTTSDFYVFVDFAHKPEALERVLQSLQQIKKNATILLVFGCGGDRDKTKRPIMGRIASKYADYIWITSDNPRTEDPIKIIEEIKSGITNLSTVVLEPCREKAIKAALYQAKAGDIVLIAGKGHETYQLIGSKKNPFDDRKIAQAILKGLEV